MDPAAAYLSNRFVSDSSIHFQDVEPLVNDHSPFVKQQLRVSDSELKLLSDPEFVEKFNSARFVAFQ